MGKGRLEAFSDGVIAIIITIMVLEVKVPHGSAAILIMRMVLTGTRYFEEFGCLKPALSH